MITIHHPSCKEGFSMSMGIIHQRPSSGKTVWIKWIRKLSATADRMIISWYITSLQGGPPPKQLPWLIQLQYLRFIFPCNCVGWIGLPTNISLRGPAGCGDIDGTKLRFTLKVFTVGSGPKAFEASEIPKLRPRGRIQGDHSSTHTRKLTTHHRLQSSSLWTPERPRSDFSERI